MKNNDSSWHQHLEQMTKFVGLRRQRDEALGELTDRFIYLRVGGNGFRPVSIRSDNPCGSVYLQGKAIETTPFVDVAIQSAKSAQHRNDELGNKKPEHRVQAHLVYQAIKDPTGLPALLDCVQFFDELIFLSDEFRLGEIRADIIALGKKDTRYFPVFIELKAERSLTRVLLQLKNISERFLEVPDAGRAYLAAGSGVDMSLIDIKPRRIIVWPASPSGKESPAVASARSKGIVTIGFTQTDGKYSFNREV
ncbi:hypothetical protein CBA19CS11_32185 [Caballeronia novacaledonica]|uniref:hypothetical protein n=1 Tax=Caballeronia novacaledonica TaxID=1544861 RepID=UPI001EE30A33|nr:hypothetical protein [Caballeronia novacaledonica]GJH13597.1 hypothetical protein CBA19CS11_32185 [Caballeronia novacaledonica]